MSEVPTTGADRCVGVDKMLPLDELVAVRRQLGATGRSVVFTNGNFDLLHVGHVRYLQEARRLGDCLIVGLNSDASTAALKGPGRPLVPEGDRAELLAALECVDYVTVFDELTAEHLVNALRPDIYVKGGDYASGKALPEAVVVAAYGGRVTLVELTDGRSTTGLIHTILSRLGPTSSARVHFPSHGMSVNRASAIIARSAFIIMTGNLTSRILGLVRTQVIAGFFGTTSSTDAFVVASTIPATTYDLLIGGAISAALVPVLATFSRERDEDFWRLAGALTGLVGLVMALVSAVLMLAAPLMIRAVGAGLPDATQVEATVVLRIMLPGLVFQGLAAVSTAILYSQQRFTFPAFGSAAYNLGLIVMAPLLAEHWGVRSLAFGVLLGTFLWLAVQAPGLVRMGLLKGRFRPWLRHPELPHILRLYTPVALGLIVSVVGIFIDRNLATHTGEGSVAAMQFATTLVQFPLGLVATAVAFAVLPLLARHASVAATALGAPAAPGSAPGESEQALTEYRQTLALGLKMVVLAILPAVTGLWALREAIVTLLFQRGAFDAEGTRLVVLALSYYLPGLPFHAVDAVLVYAFYALQNTRTPVLVGVMGVGVYLVVALALIQPMGMAGLCLANSVQIMAHAAVLGYLLWRAIRGLAGLGLGLLFLKAAVAALVMGSALYALVHLLGAAALGSVRTQLVLLVGGGALAAIVYAALLWALRVREVGLLLRIGQNRLRGKRGLG